MTVQMPPRRWGDDFELVDLLERQPGGLAFAVRDFGLLTLAARLSAEFPGQLVFKGGFVLRHVHRIVRFSKDVDATRHDPPGHKFDADYDDVVPGLFPSAPSYAEAHDIVWPRIRSLIP